MSVEALSWAFQQEITPAAKKLVLIALANRADEDGYCFPGYNRLASQCSMARRTVIYHINSLLNDGIIEKQSRSRDNGSDTSNLYRIMAGVGCKSRTPPGANFAPPECKPCTPIYEHLNNTHTHNALTRSDFLREIDKERIAGRFVAITDNEGIIGIEADNCWDYWETYPDKKPAGNLVTGFSRFLKQSHAIKAVQKLAEKSKVSAGGEVQPEPSNPVQPWHERIKLEVGDDAFRAWFRKMEFDQSSYSVSAPSNFHAQHIKQNYAQELNAILPGVKIVVKKPATQGA